MRRIVAVAAFVAFIAGCKTSEPKDMQDLSGTGAMTATAPPSMAEAGGARSLPTPAQAGVSGTVPGMASAEPLVPGGPSPRPFTGSSHAVRVRTTASGCLGQAPRGRSGGTRAPVHGPGGQPDMFQVAGQKGNVVVTQRFTHACCLTARTTATLAPGILQITTELLGEPCRCLCASTLRSSVMVPPGTYTVRVVHRVRGAVEVRAEERVVVH